MQALDSFERGVAIYNDGNTTYVDSVNFGVSAGKAWAHSSRCPEGGERRLTPDNVTVARHRGGSLCAFFQFPGDAMMYSSRPDWVESCDIGKANALCKNRI